MCSRIEEQPWLLATFHRKIGRPLQIRLIFVRIENFIDAFSETIEHPQPRGSGTVDCMRNGDAFSRAETEDSLGRHHLLLALIDEADRDREAASFAAASRRDPALT